MVFPTKQNKKNRISLARDQPFFLIKNSIAPYLESLLKAKKIEKQLDILTYNRLYCNDFVSANQKLLEFN